MGAPMTLHPCLWFERKADEAVDFYCGIFPDSRRGAATRYSAGAAMPEGSLLTQDFELCGQRLTAINTLSPAPYSHALSLVVSCDTQAELDAVWNALSARPEAERCGWLVDRFGVHWQIVPRPLMRMLADGSAAQRQRVTDALMTMGRIDLPALERAFAQA